MTKSKKEQRLLNFIRAIIGFISSFCAMYYLMKIDVDISWAIAGFLAVNEYFLECKISYLQYQINNPEK